MSRQVRVRVRSPAPPRRPGQDRAAPRPVGAPLPSPTAVLDDPADTMDSVSCASPVPRQRTAMVLARFGRSRCGTTAGRRAFPYVGSSSDTWRSARGPYVLCSAPDTAAEPLRIARCPGILLRWQVEVTFEERRLTREAWKPSGPVVGNEPSPEPPPPSLALLACPMTWQRISVEGEQRSASMALSCRTAAWYDKTSRAISFASHAMSRLVRRHSGVQQRKCPSEREPQLDGPRLYHKLLDTLA